MSYLISGRKKVRMACVPCSKSKIGCCFQRPCSNCVRKGISEQCCDKKNFYQRKKLDQGKAEDEKEKQDQSMVLQEYSMELADFRQIMDVEEEEHVDFVKFGEFNKNEEIRLQSDETSTSIEDIMENDLKRVSLQFENLESNDFHARNISLDWEGQESLESIFLGSQRRKKSLIITMKEKFPNDQDAEDEQLSNFSEDQEFIFLVYKIV
jgi:hypothetical protein